MNAVEFLKLQKRICKTYENTTCGDCPLCDHCLISNYDLDYDEEEAVRIAEEWAKENPITTYGDVIIDYIRKLTWDMSCPTGTYTVKVGADPVVIEIPYAVWKTEYDPSDED